jgi:hypothetical protein
MSVSGLMDDPRLAVQMRPSLHKKALFPFSHSLTLPLLPFFQSPPPFLLSLLLSLFNTFFPSLSLYLLSFFLLFSFSHSIILTLLSVSLALTLSPLSISHSPSSFVRSFSNSFLSHALFFSLVSQYLILPLLTFSRSLTLILSLSPRFLVLLFSPFSHAVHLPHLSFTPFPPSFFSHSLPSDVLSYVPSLTPILSLSPRFLVLSLSPFSHAVPLPHLSFTHFPPVLSSITFPLLTFSCTLVLSLFLPIHSFFPVFPFSNFLNFPFSHCLTVTLLSFYHSTPSPFTNVTLPFLSSSLPPSSLSTLTY